jgi:glutamyl-tRNA synthetase
MLRLKEMKLSKSGTRKLVEDGDLAGMDDPRTWSIQSLKRRGIRPESIRNFIKGFGLSLTDIEVPAENLYAENRKMIDQSSNRYFFVQSPVGIKLADVPKKVLEIPLHPDHREKGHRTIHIKQEIFVAEDDFDKFKGQEVRLKDFCNVMLEKDAEITSIENKDIPRIQWVSEQVPTRVVMPDGEVIEGYAEKSVNDVAEDQMVQFERFGSIRAVRFRQDGFERGWSILLRAQMN